jgi:hypothetical protein
MGTSNFQEPSLRPWRAWPAYLGLGIGLAVAAPQARATLIITPTYDSSVTGNSNAAQIENAVNYVAQQYEGLFTVPNRTVNININVMASPGTSILGQSSTGLISTSYSSMRNALISAYAPDSADLPITDPVTGTHTYFVSTAEAKTLGLMSNNTSNDGTFTFGSGFNYTYNPNNRAVSGAYDFIGVAEHEFAEIMGRVSGLGSDFGNGTPDYVPYDLFRYTGPNARGVSNGGSGVYYSLNNGTTDLKNYNDGNSNGGDSQDWAGGPADSYNAFTSPGVEENVTPIDVTAMNSLGYASAVPEPATATVALVGFGGLLLRRRRTTAV